MRDDLPHLYSQAFSLESALASAALSAADENRVYQRLRDTQREAFDKRATTPAGGLASLRWAITQFSGLHVEEPIADWHDRFILNLLTGALDVMREMVEGAERASEANAERVTHLPGSPLPDVEDAVLDLRADLCVIEGLMSDVLPENDDADRLGVARQPHHQVALIPEDARRAFLRAVDTLRVNMGTLSRVSGVGDMLA